MASRTAPSWAQLVGGHEGRVPHFSDSGDIIYHAPHIFLFRFHNILVSHQTVPLTFYNKLRFMCAISSNVGKSFHELYWTAIGIVATKDAKSSSKYTKSICNRKI